MCVEAVGFVTDDTLEISIEDDNDVAGSSEASNVLRSSVIR